MRALVGSYSGSAPTVADTRVPNTPIVAILLPVIEGWCQRRGISPSKVLLPLSVVLLLPLWFWRLRQQGPRSKGKRRDALDTVADWQPEAARVLTISERRAYDLLDGKVK